jgi:hypothetical protein
MRKYFQTEACIYLIVFVIIFLQSSSESNQKILQSSIHVISHSPFKIIFSSQGYCSSYHISLTAGLYIVGKSRSLDSFFPREHLALCLYDASSKDLDIQKINDNFGFPNPSIVNCSLLNPAIFDFPTNYAVFNITMSSFGYNPATLRFKGILLNTLILNQQNKYEIYAESTLLVDTIAKEKLYEYQPIPYYLVEETRRNLKTHYESYPIILDGSIGDNDWRSEQNFLILVFLKDLECHGCNLRLARFGCSPFYRGNLINYGKVSVQFLLGSITGKLLQYLDR